MSPTVTMCDNISQYRTVWTELWELYVTCYTVNRKDNYLIFLKFMNLWNSWYCNVEIMRNGVFMVGLQSGLNFFHHAPLFSSINFSVQFTFYFTRSRTPFSWPNAIKCRAAWECLLDQYKLLPHSLLANLTLTLNKIKSN